MAATQRVSAAWVRRLKQRRRETGDVGPRLPEASPPRNSRATTSACGPLLPNKRAPRWQHYGGSLALSTLWRRLRELDLSFKKVLRAAEQDRLDVAAERAEWRTAMPGRDPARLVFLDETWTHIALTRLYGRGPRDPRGPVPCRGPLENDNLSLGPAT